MMQKIKPQIKKIILIKKKNEKKFIISFGFYLEC